MRATHEFDPGGFPFFRDPAASLASAAGDRSAVSGLNGRGSVAVAESGGASVSRELPIRSNNSIEVRIRAT
jgi:hypothetical protein